eukprot:scaffold199577_cov31-Tisochrysis_lutea.AAC.1
MVELPILEPDQRYTGGATASVPGTPLAPGKGRPYSLFLVSWPTCWPAALRIILPPMATFRTKAWYPVELFGKDLAYILLLLKDINPIGCEESDTGCGVATVDLNARIKVRVGGTEPILVYKQWNVTGCLSALLCTWCGARRVLGITLPGPLHDEKRETRATSIVRAAAIATRHWHATRGLCSDKGSYDTGEEIHLADGEGAAEQPANFKRSVQMNRGPAHKPCRPWPIQRWVHLELKAEEKPRGFAKPAMCHCACVRARTPMKQARWLACAGLEHCGVERAGRAGQCTNCGASPNIFVLGSEQPTFISGGQWGPRAILTPSRTPPGVAPRWLLIVLAWDCKLRAKIDQVVGHTTQHVIGKNKQRNESTSSTYFSGAASLRTALVVRRTTGRGQQPGVIVLSRHLVGPEKLLWFLKIPRQASD